MERLKATLAALSDLQRQATEQKRRVTAEECEAITQEISRYHYKTVLKGIDPDGVPHFVNVPVETSTEEEELSRDLAAQLVALAPSGVLGLVRQCLHLHCKKWFVASRRHEFFCSTPHQQAHALPEVQARKRRYQRDYYRNELSPVTSRHARKPQSRRTS